MWNETYAPLHKCGIASVSEESSLPFWLSAHCLFMRSLPSRISCSLVRIFFSSRKPIVSHIVLAFYRKRMRPQSHDRRNMKPHHFLSWGWNSVLYSYNSFFGQFFSSVYSWTNWKSISDVTLPIASLSVTFAIRPTKTRPQWSSIARPIRNQGYWHSYLSSPKRLARTSFPFS